MRFEIIIYDDWKARRRSFVKEATSWIRMREAAFLIHVWRSLEIDEKWLALRCLFEYVFLILHTLSQEKKLQVIIIYVLKY